HTPNPDSTPSVMTAVAPTAAPADTPSRYGSASGLRTRACISAPARARPAPTTAARIERGNRNSQMMTAYPASTSAPVSRPSTVRHTSPSGMCSAPKTIDTMMLTTVSTASTPVRTPGDIRRAVGTDAAPVRSPLRAGRVRDTVSAPGAPGGASNGRIAWMSAAWQVVVDTARTRCAEGRASSRISPLYAGVSDREIPVDTSEDGRSSDSGSPGRDAFPDCSSGRCRVRPPYRCAPVPDSHRVPWHPRCTDATVLEGRDYQASPVPCRHRPESTTATTWPSSADCLIPAAM